MAKDTLVAVDPAKAVFEVAVSHHPGQVARQKRYSRAQFPLALAQLPPATVVMEACGSAHFWARRIRSLGHEAVLLPPHAVRPYVRRNKTDRTDTKGIGRSFYPFPCGLQRHGTARPPFKPCVRISRTRLSGGRSGRSITRSPVARRVAPGNGRFRAGGEGRGCGSSRGSSGRPLRRGGAAPCASRAGLGASPTRRCRAG